MTYENRHNLPTDIVKLLLRERYNPEGRDLGEYSATTLCNPIQQTILKRRHPDRLKSFDVIDNLWSFLGSIAHLVLAEHNRLCGDDGALVETRFFAELQGTRISGQTDYYRDGIILDFKTTRAYKIMKQDFTDWERQLNVYAWLAEENGLPVTRLRIIAFILDWSRTSLYQKGYPTCPIIDIPLTLWPKEQRTEFVHGRVRTLLQAEQQPDHDLPECSQREMWQDIRDWAVVKEGCKRAIKCYDKEPLILEHKFKSGEVAVKRMTPRKRCLNHCAAATVCSQHQRLLQVEGGEPE